jgi:putative ABC transport system permease protein
MKILDIIKTANSNLLRSKLRTFLTLLAVFVGSFTLTLTTAMGEGVKDYIDKQTQALAPKDFMIIYPKDFFSGGNSGLATGEVKEYNSEKKPIIAPKFLTQKDLEFIRNFEGVTDVKPQYPNSPEYIMVEGGKKYESNATDMYAPGLDFSLAAGSLPDINESRSFLLSYRFLKPLGFERPQDAIGKEVIFSFKNIKGEEHIERLKVSGVLINSLVGQANLLNFNLARDIYAYQNGTADSFTFIYARLEKNLPQDRIISIQKELLQKGYIAQTYEDNIKSVKKVIQIAQYSLAFFSIIVILAAALGIINTLFMSVLERTREIGLMKSLGMRRRGIFAIFSFEAISIGFWGGVLGVFIAFGVGTIINSLLSNGPLKELEGFNLMTYPLPLMAGIILGTMIVGLIAGTLPAIKAARLDPIDALRHE